MSWGGKIFLSMKNLRPEQCEGKISYLMFCKLKFTNFGFPIVQFYSMRQTEI